MRWALVLSASAGRRKSSKARFTSGLVRVSRSSVSRQWDGPTRLQDRIQMGCSLYFFHSAIHYLYKLELKDWRITEGCALPKTWYDTHQLSLSVYRIHTFVNSALYGWKLSGESVLRASWRGEALPAMTPVYSGRTGRCMCSVQSKNLFLSGLWIKKRKY